MMNLYLPADRDWRQREGDCLSHHLLLPALRTILLPSALSSALSPGAGYSRTDRPHWAAGLPRS